jgi:hypothetical protein
MSASSAEPSHATEFQRDENSLVLLQVCMANSGRDEKNEQYRLGMRLERMRAFFRSIRGQVDVISIKELRACRSEDKSAKHSATDLAAMFAYDSGLAVASCDPVKLTKSHGHVEYKPFYMAQLYDSNRLEKLSASMVHFHQEVCGSEDGAPPVGCSHLRCEYAPVDAASNVPNLNRRFVVASVHLPVAPEGLKTQICRFLAGTVLVSRIPSVAIGDFNFFRDKDESVDQRTAMNIRGSSSAMHMTTRSRPHVQVHGTFYPFPHDKTVQIDRPEVKSDHNSAPDDAYLSEFTGDRVNSDKDWLKWEYTQLETSVNTANEADGSGAKTPVQLTDHLPMFVGFKWAPISQ